MSLLLIGPPGSGKGTQGGRIAVALGLEHIAVGDLLRAEIADGTPLGEEVRGFVERGELVPDELVMQLVVPRALAASRRSGYVLDGFPRSVPQAAEARELAEPAGARPNLVGYLDVPAQVRVQRLLARAQAEGRADDTEQVIQHRLRIFEEATAPLLSYYRGEGLARIIDATGSPDEITKAILCRHDGSAVAGGRDRQERANGSLRQPAGAELRMDLELARATVVHDLIWVRLFWSDARGHALPRPDG